MTNVVEFEELEEGEQLFAEGDPSMVINDQLTFRDSFVLIFLSSLSTLFDVIRCQLWGTTRFSISSPTVCKDRGVVAFDADSSVLVVPEWM